MTFDVELDGLSLPNIRSRATLYRASRSFRESWALSAEAEEETGDGEDWVGRLRIFIFGSWSKTPWGGIWAEGVGPRCFVPIQHLALDGASWYFYWKKATGLRSDGRIDKVNNARVLPDLFVPLFSRRLFLRVLIIVPIVFDCRCRCSTGFLGQPGRIHLLRT